jgi:hypothetical protein
MRPRFSLKALLVLVTLIALATAFVVWQNRIVDERQALLAEILTQGGGYVGAANVANNTATFEVRGTIVNEEENNFEVQTNSQDPWPLRRWLGDTAIRFIWVPNETTSADLAATVSVLFPEAQVRQLRSTLRGTLTFKGNGRLTLQLPLKSAPLTPQN